MYLRIIIGSGIFNDHASLWRYTLPTKIQGILSYDAILYIYFLQTTRKTQRRCCSMQNVRIVNLIRSKPSVIVTSLSFNHISNKLAILMTLSIGNQLVQLVQVQ